MIKQIIYIIKRVIIGFLIGVLLFLFKSNFALAVEIPNARYTYTNEAGTANATFADATRVSAFTGAWLKGQPRIRLGLNKVAFEIKNNDYLSTYKNSPYNYSFYVVINRPGNVIMNTLPNVEFNSVSCQVMTSYWNNNGGTEGAVLPAVDGAGEVYGGWFGVLCPDVTLTSSTSYVNIYFQNYDQLLSTPMDIYLARYWDVARSGTIDALYQLIDLERTGNTIANSQSNAIQTQTEEIKKQTQAIKDMNDTIKSEDAPSDSQYRSLSDNNANNGVINQLITMPITLAQSYLNGFNSSCTPFRLGTLYGEELILPCINPQNYLGAIWSVIDVIISGIFIFVFGKKLVKIFNDVTNLKENQVNEVFD